ncbi:unnamed protein product [Pleuronectes platessa]|uniref:Uncharacterized protein n=1 Tax=Pleuronectes platessa TaxID=8262 RepID=A0A9N7Y7E5_PLEPL|nr:unnamed protein product [Pleuronectes platessa]
MDGICHLHLSEALQLILHGALQDSSSALSCLQFEGFLQITEADQGTVPWASRPHVASRGSGTPQLSPPPSLLASRSCEIAPEQRACIRGLIMDVNAGVKIQIREVEKTRRSGNELL